MKTDISLLPLPIVRLTRGSWRLPHSECERTQWVRTRAKTLAPTEDAVAACEEIVSKALAEDLRSVTIALDYGSAPTSLIQAIRQLGQHASAAEQRRPISGRDDIASVTAIAKETEAITTQRSRPMSWIAIDFPAGADDVAGHALEHFSQQMQCGLVRTISSSMRMLCATTDPIDGRLSSSMRSMRLSAEFPFAIGAVPAFVPTGSYGILSSVPKRYGMPGGINRGCALPIRQRGSAKHRTLAAQTYELCYRYSAGQDPSTMAFPLEQPLAPSILEAANAYCIQCGGTDGQAIALLEEAIEWYRNARESGLPASTI